MKGSKLSLVGPRGTQPKVLAAQGGMDVPLPKRTLTVRLKAGFHMIADRNKVCNHMETTSAIVCDPAIAIADDRRR